MVRRECLSEINLNKVSGEPNIVYVFIVYKLTGYDSNAYWTRNGLFGHDN